MSERSDIDRLLGHWLDDGPSTMPDRVVDVVAYRIARQRQRSARRVDWRRYTTLSPFRLAATMVAVAIVAVIGYNLLPNGSNATGGPQPTAKPSTPNPTATPSVEVIGECIDPVSKCRGTLAAGTYGSREFGGALTYTVPSGWVNNIDRLRAFGLSSDKGYIGLMTGPFVVGWADSDCPGYAPAGAGNTLTEVVASLSRDPRLLIPPAQVLSIGDRTAEVLDLQIAPSWTGTCVSSQGLPAVNLLSTTGDRSGPGFGLAGTERTRAIFVDVGGSVVAINIGVSDTKTDFDAFVAEAMPIIESMRFGP